MVRQRRLGRRRLGHVDSRGLDDVPGGLYVEHMFGNDDALKYINGYKTKVRNRAPIITPRGIHRSPPQDQYFKGALFLNTLRSGVNDDREWWKLMRDFYQKFKYQNIMTEDVVAFFNKQTGKN